MENEKPDKIAKLIDEEKPEDIKKPKTKNRRHTAMVVVLFVFFIIFLLAEGILYIPFLPRNLSAYKSSTDEGTTFYIQPFGKVDKDSLDYIKEFLEKDSGRPVIILQSKKMPSLAWGRPLQADADFLLTLLASEKRYFNDSFRILGVTKSDIYSKDTDFVMGLASPEDKDLVISLYMIIPRNPDSSSIKNPSARDYNLYHKRIRKIFRHEIGHTCGLWHCPNPFCLMAFSNSVAQQDSASEYFCPICQVRLATQ